MNDKNYDNQIRYELTSKLKEYVLSIFEMEKIEKETGEDFDILIDTNTDYRRLSDKCSSSKFDIDWSTKDILDDTPCNFFDKSLCLTR